MQSKNCSLSSSKVSSTAKRQGCMSFFRRLSTGFKSEPPSSPVTHSSESETPAPSAISDSLPPSLAVDVVPAKAFPFEFWNSNLTVQSVEEAKSKLLDLNAKDPYGEPALIRAARHGDANVTKALLAASVDINSADSNGETAISWAAQMGKAEVLKILIDRPDVFIDKKDKGGRTALYDACCCQFRYFFRSGISTHAHLTICIIQQH